MRTLIDIFIIVAISVAAVIAFRIPYFRCDTPVSYKLGFVDSRFNLPSSQILSDIDEASNVWDKAEGKKLFTYLPESGVLTINFNYDERTALDSSVNQKQGELNQKNDTLKEEINAYESDVTAYEKKVADFNNVISGYNRQGGAPKDVYTSLVNQQNQLRSEGDALNARARQLNLTTKDYNSQVRSLNQDVNQLNQAIAQKPEEGLYNGADNTITIYFASSQPELVHTLSHEFGHALGMNHVEDPNALMYKYKSSYLGVTADDKLELDKACSAVPLPQHWIEELRYELMPLVKDIKSSMSSILKNHNL